MWPSLCDTGEHVKCTWLDSRDALSYKGEVLETSHNWKALLRKAQDPSLPTWPPLYPSLPLPPIIVRLFPDMEENLESLPTTLWLRLLKCDSSAKVGPKRLVQRPAMTEARLLCGSHGGAMAKVASHWVVPASGPGDRATDRATMSPSRPSPGGLLCSIDQTYLLASQPASHRHGALPPRRVERSKRRQQEKELQAFLTQNVVEARKRTNIVVFPHSHITLAGG